MNTETKVRVYLISGYGGLSHLDFVMFQKTDSLFLFDRQAGTDHTICF